MDLGIRLMFAVVFVCNLGFNSCHAKEVITKRHLAAAEGKTGSSSNRPFGWKRCDTIPSPVEILQLDVKPDPIRLGEDATLTFVTNLKKNIGVTGPIELDLDLKMKIDGTYEEMCGFIGYNNCYIPDICKTPFVRCPITQGIYPMNITHPTPEPPYRIFGAFEATLVLRENGKDIACIQTWFSLSDNRTG